MGCDLKDEQGRMHNVHPSFVNLSVEISELKDEKARMHHVYPWSHPEFFPAG